MSEANPKPAKEPGAAKRWNPANGTSRRFDVIVILSLVLLTAAVYGQVIGFQFIGYDDPDYVTDNPFVRKGLSWAGFRWAFTTFTQANWHPLTWLSHMLDVQLFGPDPGFHHAVNVLFHLLNTALIFWILRLATGARWRSAFVAALFALHPLHVESVAWISERKDVLSTLFWFLALWAYVRYAGKPGLTEYLSVLLFFALGLLAKPMLVTLPIVLLLLDYWPLKRLGRRSPVTGTAPALPPATGERKAKKRNRQRKDPSAGPFAKSAPERRSVLPVLTEKLPLLALSAASGLMTLYAQQKGGAVVPLTYYVLPDRLANAVVSYAAYLCKAIWPAGLVFFYPLQAHPPVLVFAAAGFFAGMTALALWKAERWPWLTFGWLWYVITLLPVIGIVKVGSAAMADRYTYVALLGPFITLAWGAVELSRALRIPRAALAAASALVIGTCALLTYNQAGTWRDGISLAGHALGGEPRNFLAQTLLASEYIQRGKYDDAMTHAKAALEINPRGEKALTDMGLIQYHRGAYADAAGSFEQALRANPNSPSLHEWLGRTSLATGDFDRAAAQFRQALQPGRDNAVAQAGLGEALIYQNRLDEALQYTRQAIESQPQNARLYNNAGFILARQNRIDEAIAQFRIALKLSPDYARAHNNLGSALLMKGEDGEAIRHFEEALRIDPDYRIARENLRDAQAQQKKGRR